MTDGKDERDSDALLDDAGRLATEISPQRDLWPEIRAGIGAGRGTAGGASPTRWFAQAAAVVLVGVSSATVTWFLMQDSGSGVGSGVSPVVDAGLQAEPVAVSCGGSSGVASFGGNCALGVGYNDARDTLNARLETELQRLSPEARDDVRHNLQLIRGAIADINAALEEQPDNAHLQELLLKTYREELAVMRNVGNLTNDVMSRNDI